MPDRDEPTLRADLPSDQYRLLVESVRDYAIFMLDPTGHVISWNTGAERLKGYKRAEILGRHFSTFYTAEDLATDKPGRELEVAAREGRVEDEGWRVRKDGTLFWANVVITALRDKTNTLVGFAKDLRVRSIPCSAALKALADRGNAEQIVLNLLSNAAKFTPRGGLIEVSCAARDGRAIITVSDSGPGIPVDRQNDIFEPFVQLGRTLASGHEGTGLGLAISRDLARAMSGDLTVESTPGSGSTFTLLLRLA